MQTGPLTVNTKRLDPLMIDCTRVYTAGRRVDYLRVSPVQRQWVYPQAVRYEVESNVEWQCE